MPWSRFYVRRQPLPLDLHVRRFQSLIPAPLPIGSSNFFGRPLLRAVLHCCCRLPITSRRISLPCRYCGSFLSAFTCSPSSFASKVTIGTGEDFFCGCWQWGWGAWHMHLLRGAGIFRPAS